MKIEAHFYSKENKHIICNMCPHNCKIMPGKMGLCRARKHEDGKLWAINYGMTTSIAIDPIEKKPLYHFYPGSKILSIACNNCNMQCPFCQNWNISQEEVRTQYLSPETLLNIYQERPSIGIAYTYTEPLMWYEYILDVGELIHKEGGKNILVTNGLINEKPLRNILPLIDAMNIDLKAMNAEVYNKTLHGNLDAVKRTIEIGNEHCHIEITNLLVTGLNTHKREIKKLIDYIALIDSNIPLHLSRYYPNYRYDQPPTPMKRLEYAYATAKEKLKYVYMGNVPSDEGSNTCCPNCNSLLVERMYYQAMNVGLKNNTCKKCGEKINIITSW